MRSRPSGGLAAGAGVALGTEEEGGRRPGAAGRHRRSYDERGCTAGAQIVQKKAWVGALHSSTQLPGTGEPAQNHHRELGGASAPCRYCFPPVDLATL